MPNMQQMVDGQNNAHVVFNEAMESLSAAAIFSKNPATTTGLTWGYYGGLYVGNTVPDGTLDLTDSATNYIVVNRSTGVVSVSTSSANSADPAYAALYKVTTASGAVTAIVDKRMDSNGLLINALSDSIITVARSIPVATTLATGECLPITTDTTIGSMAAGSAPSVYNNSGSPVTLFQDTGMTMRLAGTSSTGDRTLAGRGLASFWFASSTEVVVTGAGLS